jgi:hypothetical protein
LADWEPNFEIWFSDASHVNTCRSEKYAPWWEPYFESAPNIKQANDLLLSSNFTIAFRRPGK